MESCAKCKFYRKMTADCRREPPKVFPLTMASGEFKAIGLWPPTKDANWCGEFSLDLTVAS